MVNASLGMWDASHFTPLLLVLVLVLLLMLVLLLVLLQGLGWADGCLMGVTPAPCC
jgi:hypothetical protein